MKKLLILLFIGLIGTVLHAQQLLMPEETTLDSTQADRQRRLEYQKFLHGNLPLFPLSKGLQTPGFNNSALQPTYNFSFEQPVQFNYKLTDLSVSPFSSPFLMNTEISSGAIYHAGNKLTVGGFNYKGNSLPLAPLPMGRPSYFNTYGSSLFMQYKISKNVKIETRFDIQQYGNSNSF